ncbi:MAG: hypothetical protein AAGK00_13970 [Pseudomonadota bacterium]
MRILMHLGLNKCASTTIQSALSNAAKTLSEAGVYYPLSDSDGAHYGLSKYYGFGPVNAEIRPTSLADLVAEARIAGCHSLILSSEYMSLYAPRAVRTVLADLTGCGADTRFLLFRRSTDAWIRSLFNQYVKTVDGGDYLPSIDAFAKRVLNNGAIDVARRVLQWRDSVGASRVDLVSISEHGEPGTILGPFEAFADCRLACAVRVPENVSINTDALYAIGRLRQESPSNQRDREIAKLLAGSTPAVSAPEDYVRLGAETRRQLQANVTEPADALGWRPIGLEAGVAA